MKFLGHRFCYVGEAGDALAMSKILASLGIPPKAIFSKEMSETEALNDGDFSGAIFASDENNWVEIWSELPNVPKGFMLQLIVDDADAFAENARQNGLEPQGPVESHGERIYYLVTPFGLPISFQSVLAKTAN